MVRMAGIALLGLISTSSVGGCLERAWAQSSAAPRDAGPAVVDARAETGALRALEGDRAGESFGRGGLGQRHGGSSGATHLGSIGIGTIGTMGHGAGPGTGGQTGYGSGRAMGPRPGATRAIVEPPTVREAGLPGAAVRRIVMRNRGIIAFCLESHGGLPDAGTLTASVRFVIQPDGSVSAPDVRVEGVPIALGGCLANRFRGMLFPATVDHAPVPVVQPIRFARGPGEN